MKNNIKLFIYVIIIALFASVVWIKFDYDQGKVIYDETNSDHFLEFISDNSIEQLSFSCEAKNETIIYLDNNYLLTSLGDLYQVKFDSIFENGHNCKRVETLVKIKGFYNSYIVYDEEYNFYDLENNLNSYNDDISQYYLEDLKNLEIISREYPYIYFYDVEAKNLNLDSKYFSNKLLIDNKGNINIYTNYGYPTALNLLLSEDTELIFDRNDYKGEVLAIFRSNNNELLDKDRIKYLESSMEVSDKVYGIRLITSKGLYNEIIDDGCKDDLCSTKLDLDEDFSMYFNNITYSNGKYIFIKDTPTTIYNIEKYVGAK